MNYKSIRRVGINEPPDGFTKLEEDLASLLTQHTIYSLYAKLPTPRMKFIVAAHFELGYPQWAVAEMLGIKQPSLNDEINLIKRVLLGKTYSTNHAERRRKKKPISESDVLKVLYYLSNSQ